MLNTNNMEYLLFQVGEEFPDQSFQGEGIMLKASYAFIDLVAQLPNITKQEIEAWNSGGLKYGLFVRNNTPFILFKFGDAFCFASSFNALKIKKDHLSEWLETESNLIKFFLINSDTNKIEAMRAITVHFSFESEFKEACRKQVENFDSILSVDRSIMAIEESYSVKEMIKETRMYKTGF